MRRYDGTTMRDGVYERMMMDRSTGIAQARNPPESVGRILGHRPDGQHEHLRHDQPERRRESMNMNSTREIDPRMNELRDASMDIFMAAVEKYGTEEMIEASRVGAHGPNLQAVHQRLA